MNRIGVTIGGIAALTLLGAFASAGVRPFLRHRAVESRKATPYRTQGSWSVSPGGKPISVRWTCTPFHRVGRRQHLANARMRIRTSKSNGQVVAKVIKSSDSTSIEKGYTRADTLASVQGKGLAVFAIELEIDKEGCPSGEYRLDVDATISSL